VRPPIIRRKSRQGFPRRPVPLRWVCLEVCRAEQCSDRSQSLLATGRTAFIEMRQSMRCQRVRANVSPMRGMLSLVLMLIKPALLS
jgi:hypothetical protein